MDNGCSILDLAAEDTTIPTTNSTQPLPEQFGRNLDTLEKARLWLTNPHNWHESKLFILRWNGLLCTVNREHGARLIREAWDDGIPWAAVTEQRRRRAKGEQGEPLEEESLPVGEG
jgi:hypothetical protein